MNKLHVKLKLKRRLRLKPFLFILDTNGVYEQPDGAYDVYELYECVLPFIYKWTGVRTIFKQGCPIDHNRLRRIINTYKEKGYV